MRHRRASLPERAELASREEAIARIGAELEAMRPAWAEAGSRQRRLETELASVEEKIAAAEKRLYSGMVTAPRDLQALEADIQSMKRHRSRLEDEVLEAMAEAEPLDSRTARLEEERSGLDEEATTLRAAIDVASQAIDKELAALGEARADLVGRLPPELVSLYDRLRAKLGGVGAAPLVNGSCGGCHMVLPAIEIDAIRHQPPEAIVRCDQCGRILVR